ncbi:MAG TPA: hemerythrin domain-containing protein [Kofleriaceae bacterium]|nr:hemerythrin domain-containing protein [Kofleriaceae bacterium]
MDTMIAKGTGAVKSVEARLHGLTGVFKTLAEQHGEVSALMKRVKSDADKRADLWPTIRMELVSHEKGELREVYPVLRELPETRMMADRHDAEAGALETLIDRINNTPTASEEWGQFFEQLVNMVENHAEEEEAQIFPVAQKAIGAQRAKEIDARFLAAKKQIAHTV